VGIVGLGAGTLAAYGKPLDEFTFYEIDPLVSRVANSKFSFLKLSLATVKIVIGDGRLSLEKEPPQKFDLLVIDAFSGDTIPTHLLTREAFELYFSKLKAGGAIAVHISNRYVDLMPVLAEVSATLDKPAVLVKSYLNDTSAALASDWVLVANNLVAFRDMPRASWNALPRSPGFEVWTDDYSNILQLLK
jgi:spermidine synthase